MIVLFDKAILPENLLCFVLFYSYFKDKNEGFLGNGSITKYLEFFLPFIYNGFTLLKD